MDEIEQKLTTLRKKRDSLMTSFFWLGLQIALIFGVPAALAAVLGTWLDKSREDSLFTTIFLVTAFILSWVMVYFRYKKYSTELYAVESEIADIKSKLDTKDHA
jgi:hypothetical protein